MKCSNARNSSPSTISITATVAAVISILRSTRRLVAASSEAVISTNGTSASFGPMPISSTRNVSITPAAVIDVCPSSSRHHIRHHRDTTSLSDPAVAAGRSRAADPVVSAGVILAAAT